MIIQNGKSYKEVRCHNCRTLLALEYIFSGRLSIKCHKCNEINEIRYKTPKKLLNKLLVENGGEKQHNDS